MKRLGLTRDALTIGAAVALLAGCGAAQPPAGAPAGAQGNHLVNGHFIPGWSKIANPIPVELQHTPSAALDRITPDRHHKKRGIVGIYGSTFDNSFINGYKGADPKNGPPLCSLGASYVNDIAVDGKGNLIVPNGLMRKVIIYQPECGLKLGVLDSDAYYLGEPSDAALLRWS